MWPATGHGANVIQRTTSSLEASKEFHSSALPPAALAGPLTLGFFRKDVPVPGALALE